MEQHVQLKEALQDFLRRSLVSFNDITVEAEQGGIIRLNVMTDEPALIIGKHAETLFALQQVFRLVVRRKYSITEHLIIDVDNYRRSQEMNAVQMAKTAAARAKETGLAQELMPMPSYKRRAVHTLFTTPEFQDFRVYSVGEGDERRVRVELKPVG